MQACWPEVPCYGMSAYLMLLRLCTSKVYRTLFPDKDQMACRDRPGVGFASGARTCQSFVGDFGEDSGSCDWATLCEVQSIEALC